METGPTLHHATVADLPEVLTLFRETVLAVNRQDYTLEQVQVWAKGAENLARWEQAIREQYFLLARIEEKLTGFGSLDQNGCIDFLYIHKNHQGQGIATTLFHAMEGEARREKVQELTTDASITARPFFERQGFHVKQRQEQVRESITLVNFRMLKRLG